MGIRTFSKARAFRAICALVLLAAVSGAYAQNLTVTAANASNDAIYDVNFVGSGGSITVLNNDGGSLHSLKSVTFAANIANHQLDLLAADNQGGLRVRYFSDFPSPPSSGTRVDSFPPVIGGVTVGGPSNPDGLSVDPFGDVFVVNSASGPSTQAQVWELAFDPTGLTLQNTTQIDASFGP